MTDFQNAGDIATALVNRWAWYQSALADPSKIGTKALPVHENEPQQGYYRTRRKGGPWEPVAIFYPEDTDELVAYRNGREVRPDDIWTWVCRNPVSFEAYNQAMDGKGWPDDEPVVAAQADPGHNSGDVDEAEALRDQIEAAKQGADAYKTITDDETLSKAQSLRSRLNELAKEADKQRETLKRPHLEAGKAVDKKWQPIIKDAKSAADGIRAAMSVYETDKLRKQREAERKAEEKRRKAEEDARAAQQAGQPAPAPTPEPEPEPAPVAAPAPIKGSYGKAASVKVKQVVTEITDAKALFGFLNGHPELDDTMLKLAQRAVEAGRTVPGVKIDEKADVR